MASLLELPLELFEALISLLLSLGRLCDAAKLTQTCRALRFTDSSRRVSYLRARTRLCLSVDEAAETHLQHATRALLSSSWPHAVPESGDAALLGPSSSRYEGTPHGARPRGTPLLRRDKVYDLSMDGSLLLAQQLAPRIARDDDEICAPPSEERVESITGIHLPSPASAYSVDAKADMAVTVSVRRRGTDVEGNVLRQIRVNAIELRSGRLLKSFNQAPSLFDPSEVRVEVHGSSVLLRQGNLAEVRRLAWQGEDDFNSEIRTAWPLIWAPKVISSSQRLLCAHLLSDSVLMLIRSAPATSDHGLDWGSTLEIYNLHQSQPLVAEIRLPIRARPVPGLSYIKCGASIGDKSNLRGQRRNALMLICVEGMIWQAELESFLDLIYPGTALALYTPGQPTYPILDASWVKANMSRFSLCISEGAPVAETSASGFRMVAIWRTARQTAGYIRFVDLTPPQAAADSESRSSRREEIMTRGGGKEVAIFRTWWAEKERPFIYYDHAFEDYLPDQNVQHTSVMLDGARLLLSSARAVATPSRSDGIADVTLGEHLVEAAESTVEAVVESASRNEEAWEVNAMDGGRAGTLPFAAVWLI
ncbi:hypothetical protein IE81DRAFT_320651 [Ceraceosorus guamensis]|uniref:F-box domain-containing protein n=1 Tax=Ceraceosorus guamensis TaxID=1522189 RepID=A0A316W5W6_9BASI|nr:hypothetical protein IE81DRAFT_320651 [Ceraceosorus guamensis]PWN45054.1 hypothetical protein IE81DRAFT_320651 [Ceraceosorus guamensis]